MTVVALALLPVAPSLSQPARQIEFDCVARHQFGGFGLNVWGFTGRMAPLLRLVQDLHVKFVRWPLPPNVSKVDVPEDGTFSALVNWADDLALAQQKAAGQDIFQFADRLSSLGIDQIAASWGFPESWRTRNPESKGQFPKLLDDARIEDFGRVLAAQLAVLDRHKVRPYAIEPMSELVTRIFPKRYAWVLQSFRAWVKRAGISPAPIAGPGTVRTWENGDYLRAVAQQGGDLDILTTHVYDAVATHRLASLSAFTSAIPPGWRRPIFVTESGINPNVWFHDRNASGSQPYAALAAAQILALYGSGANAVLYWEAQDAPWDTENMGLLDKQDRPRPAVGALQTVVKPLRVGDQIASTVSAEAMPMMLVARPSQLLLEIANPAPQDRTYTISLRGCGPGPFSMKPSAVWPAQRTIEVQSTGPHRLQITVPGNTVASVTASH